MRRLKRIHGENVFRHNSAVELTKHANLRRADPKTPAAAGGPPAAAPGGAHPISPLIRLPCAAAAPHGARRRR